MEPMDTDTSTGNMHMYNIRYTGPMSGPKEGMALITRASTAATRMCTSQSTYLPETKVPFHKLHMTHESLYIPLVSPLRSPIMENQLEKKLKNEMETVVYRIYGL